MPPPRLTTDQKRAARLLRELTETFGITPEARRTFFMLLSRETTHLDALETIVGIIGMAGDETPQRIARAGIEWLDEMLAEYHARELGAKLARLVELGLDAMKIAETFNDAGIDETHNGGQPFGELHIRRACRVLGLKVSAVRWR